MKILSWFPLIICWGAVVTAQGQDQSNGFHKTTQAQQQAWHAQYIERQGALPFDRRDTIYIYLNKDRSKIAPAVLDEKTWTVYQWRGVVFQPNQIPRLMGPNTSGSGFVLPIDPYDNGYHINYMDPPIRYLALAKTGKYCIGYYDCLDRIFYEWNDVKLDRDQLPADSESKHLILTNDDIENTTTINPPTQ